MREKAQENAGSGRKGAGKKASRKAG